MSNATDNPCFVLDFTNICRTCSFLAWCGNKTWSLKSLLILFTFMFRKDVYYLINRFPVFQAPITLKEFWHTLTILTCWKISLIWVAVLYKRNSNLINNVCSDNKIWQTRNSQCYTPGYLLNWFSDWSSLDLLEFWFSTIWIPALQSSRSCSLVTILAFMFSFILGNIQK